MDMNTDTDIDMAVEVSDLAVFTSTYDSQDMHKAWTEICTASADNSKNQVRWKRSGFNPNRYCLFELLFRSA
jgi:hypothetical protein